jgi:hypothetical protein
MEVKETFASLLEVAAAELEKIQREGAAFFTVGDTTRVRAAADRVERLKALVEKISALRAEWEALIPVQPPPLPQPSLIAEPRLADTDAFESAQPAAPRHVFPDRAQPHQRTPQSEYRLPILTALVALNGRVQVALVLDRVEKIMLPRLNRLDLEQLPGGSDFRWRNAAQWERHTMVQEGLLSQKAPHSIWEITPAGREYLKNHSHDF